MYILLKFLRDGTKKLTTLLKKTLSESFKICQQESTFFTFFNQFLYNHLIKKMIN